MEGEGLLAVGGGFFVGFDGLQEGYGDGSELGAGAGRLRVVVSFSFGVVALPFGDVDRAPRADETDFLGGFAGGQGGVELGRDLQASSVLEAYHPADAVFGRVFEIAAVLVRKGAEASGHGFHGVGGSHGEPKRVEGLGSDFQQGTAAEVSLESPGVFAMRPIRNLDTCVSMRGLADLACVHERLSDGYSWVETERVGPHENFSDQSGGGDDVGNLAPANAYWGGAENVQAAIEGGAYVALVQVGRAGYDDGVDLGAEQKVVDRVEKGVVRDLQALRGAAANCGVGIGDSDDVRVFQISETGGERSSVVGSDEGDTCRHGWESEG